MIGAGPARQASKQDAGQPAEESASSCCPCVACHTRPPLRAAQGSTAGAALRAPPAAHSMRSCARGQQLLDAAALGCLHSSETRQKRSTEQAEAGGARQVQWMHLKRYRGFARACMLQQLTRTKSAGGAALHCCMHWVHRHTQRGALPVMQRWSSSSELPGSAAFCLLHVSGTHMQESLACAAAMQEPSRVKRQEV